MFNLYGKVALITGAQHTMGKAYANALASQGAKVILADTKEKLFRKTATDIVARGGEAYCFEMDVTQKEQIDVTVEKVVKQFGRLDILVNCAGIFKPKPALEITEKEWDETISVNLKGQFLCAQRAAKEMGKNKWGRIINISWIAPAGEGIGFGGPAHSTASKGGMIGMNETLADEWAPLGINVNAIALGAIETPRVEGARISKEAKKAILEHIPLHRMGKPEEVSGAVVFLASQEASYITGATIYVDGGWLSS
ncbi:MAG: SDR family oxidoreductase [Kiritimatiellales bacterium]|nr:SDR family oxidoreductase [Kiritimatiellales bacterium]